LYSQLIIARDLSRVDGRSKVLLHPWERFQDVDRRGMESLVSSRMVTS
jgi:hypothetical protein